MGLASNRPEAVEVGGLRGLVAAFGMLLALLLQAPAMAQEEDDAPSFDEFGAFVVDPDDPDAIYLNGPIDDAALLDFRRARRSYPEADTLVLNSPGGLLRTALALADEAYEAGFSTVIPGWAGCYSACAFIFLAGVERIAFGELGVHQFSSDDPNIEDAQRVMADVFEMLGRFDTPQPVITVMLRTPADDMYVFAAEEIAELNLNRGFDSGGTEIFEAAGAFLPTYASPPQVLAEATLYLDPAGDNEEYAGEVAWEIGNQDGEIVAIAYVAFDEGVGATVVFAGPGEPDDDSGLIIGLWPESELLTGDGARGIEGVWVVPQGFDRFDPMSFGQVDYDEEDARYTLLSLRRWLARDLSLLERAETIEVLFTGGSQGDVLLSIGVNDAVAEMLSEALTEWELKSADYPIGDDPDLEISRTAFLYEGEDPIGLEAEATWYRVGDLLAVRLVSGQEDMSIDVEFGRDEINLVLYPTHLFAEGLEAIEAISIDQDLRWEEGGPGLYTAALGTADPRRMAALLGRADGMELSLRSAAGEPLHVFVDKGASFDTLLEMVAEIWADQPVATTAAPAENPQTPAPQQPTPQAAQPTVNRAAPDWSLRPAFGEISLRTGFRPDPFVISVVSGGPIDARTALGRDCAGYVAEAPDFRLNFEAGEFMLFISVVSNADTTLVVNDPNGNWICDDDGGGGVNPLVWWDYPVSGQYDIWVGTFAGPGNYDADLYISEIGGPQDLNVGQVAPEPESEMELVASFRDWDVVAVGEACYAGTAAFDTEPREGLFETTVLFIDVHGLGGRAAPVLSFDYALNEEYYVTAYVDNADRPYDFVVGEEDTRAYLIGRSEQNDMAAAMRRGVRLDAVSVTLDGTQRVDSFSLLGYTAAVNYAVELCG